MTVDNFIKCRFCAWTTHKWGIGSNTGKAFARLAKHIGEDHPAEDEKLSALRADDDLELDEAE